MIGVNRAVARARVGRASPAPMLLAGNGVVYSR
jgi:hypothetical protein